MEKKHQHPIFWDKITHPPPLHNPFLPGRIANLIRRRKSHHSTHQENKDLFQSPSDNKIENEKRKRLHNTKEHSPSYLHHHQTHWWHCKRHLIDQTLEGSPQRVGRATKPQPQSWCLHSFSQKKKKNWNAKARPPPKRVITPLQKKKLPKFFFGKLELLNHCTHFQTFLDWQRARISRFQRKKCQG